MKGAIDYVAIATVITCENIVFSRESSPGISVGVHIS